MKVPASWPLEAETRMARTCAGAAGTGGGILTPPPVAASLDSEWRGAAGWLTPSPVVASPDDERREA
jgi:hypothetical protein